MKNITLLLLSFFLSLNLAKAQTDPCVDIKKTRNETQHLTEYDTPGLQHISLNKTLVDNEPLYGVTLTMFFSLNIKNADYDAKGVYVTFADGTTWKVLRASTDCSYINSDYGYSLTAAKVLESEDITILKTKKIVKINIGDHDVNIDDTYATKFIAYVKCIDDIKK